MKPHPRRAIASTPAIAVCSSPQLGMVILTLNVPLGTVYLSAPHDDSAGLCSPVSTLNSPHCWARKPMNEAAEIKPPKFFLVLIVTLSGTIP